MSIITIAPAVPARGHPEFLDRLRAYFFADLGRTMQTVLGLIWLLDSGLQFQSFMYGPGFIRSLTAMAPAQPHWLASPLLWGASTMQHHQALDNTLCALIEMAIGFGILYRQTVKQSLVFSFVWALVVWCFGEALGMLFISTDLRE